MWDSEFHLSYHMDRSLHQDVLTVPYGFVERSTYVLYRVVSCWHKVRPKKRTSSSNLFMESVHYSLRCGILKWRTKRESWRHRGQCFLYLISLSSSWADATNNNCFFLIFWVFHTSSVDEISLKTTFGRSTSSGGIQSYCNCILRHFQKYKLLFFLKRSSGTSRCPSFLFHPKQNSSVPISS